MLEWYFLSQIIIIIILFKTNCALICDIFMKMSQIRAHFVLKNIIIIIIIIIIVIMFSRLQDLCSSTFYIVFPLLYCLFLSSLFCFCIFVLFLCFICLCVRFITGTWAVKFAR